MINDDIQKQESGDNSLNQQTNSGNNTVNNITINQYLISKNNAPGELTELYTDNATICRHNAEKIALKRVEEINSALIDAIIAEPNNANMIFERMNEPDMQMAIFEAQKSYAKYGDDTKMQLFVKLLIGKGKEQCNSLKNILLDDAINTVSKLNQQHIDFLSFLDYKFCFISSNIADVNELYQNHIKKIIPYAYTLNILGNDALKFLEQFLCVEVSKFNIIDCNIVDMIARQVSLLFPSANNLKQELYRVDPNLEQIIETDIRMPAIYLTPLGTMIGLKNIELKTGDILDWSFK